MFKFLALLALIGLCSAAVPAKSVHELTGQELVDYINQQGKWKATIHPRFQGKSHGELKSLLGAYPRPIETLKRNAAPVLPLNMLAKQELPKEFNTATAFPECADLVNLIADQSTCGSCWAVSTSGAMQDRMCVASKGAIKTPLSAWDLLECCKDCGEQCHGGYIDEAFTYMRNRGIVSGSNYTSGEGCKPYPIKPCYLDAKSHHSVCPEAPKESYFKCNRECQDSYTEQSYTTDKYFGDAYTLFNDEPERAMRDMMEHGSLVSALEVYEDFYHYDGGVYEHVAGRRLGGHAVRVVGWGEDNGTPYWLVANSWHDFWGEKGYFRIKRNTNECGFEETMYGGLADPDRSKHVKA